MIAATLLSVTLLTAPADLSAATPAPEILFYEASMAGYGRDYERQDEIVRFFLRHHADHPLAPELALSSVQGLLERGELERAEKLLEWLAGLDLPPELAHAVSYWRAQVLADGPRAASLLGEVSRRHPLYGAEALATRLELALESGAPPGEWSEDLKQFARLYPADHRLHDLKFRVLGRLAEMEDAGEAAELYQQLFTDDADPLAFFGYRQESLDLLLKSGDREALMNQLSALLADVPPGAERGWILFELARRLQEEGLLLPMLAPLDAPENGNDAAGEQQRDLLAELAETAAGEGPLRDGIPLPEAVSRRDLHHLLLYHYARRGNREAFGDWVEKTLDRYPRDERSYGIVAALYQRLGMTDSVSPVLLRGIRNLEDDSTRADLEAALEGVTDASRLAPPRLGGYGD